MPEHFSSDSIPARHAGNRATDALRKAAEARFAETRFPADAPEDQRAFGQIARPMPTD